MMTKKVRDAQVQSEPKSKKEGSRGKYPTKLVSFEKSDHPKGKASNEDPLLRLALSLGEVKPSKRPKHAPSTRGANALGLILRHLVSLAARLDDALRLLALDDTDVGEGRAVTSLARGGLGLGVIHLDTAAAHLGVSAGVNAVPSITAGEARAGGEAAGAVHRALGGLVEGAAGDGAISHRWTRMILEEDAIRQGKRLTA